MCDPVTATGIALSAGGSLLQSREQNKNAKRAMNAKNQAYSESMNRQSQFQDEAGQAFNAIRTTPDYNQGAVSSTPKNVVIARQRASDEAGAETDRDVGSFATLNGYRGAQFNQGLDSNRFARAFGNIQDSASRDARLLPMEMSAAENNSQKAPGILPVLMSAAGKGLNLYGAANPGSTFFDGMVQQTPNRIANGIPVPGTKPVFQQGLFSKAFGGFK